MFLVCELDGCNYSRPGFCTFSSIDKAKESIREELHDYYELEFTDKEFSDMFETMEDGCVRMTCDLISFPIEFEVYQIFEMDKPWCVVRYHGYLGVDFEIIGQYETEAEAIAEQQKQIQEFLKENKVVDYYPGDDVLNDDNEWIGFKVVDCKEENK